MNFQLHPIDRLKFTAEPVASTPEGVLRLAHVADISGYEGETALQNAPQTSVIPVYIVRNDNQDEVTSALVRQSWDETLERTCIEVIAANQSSFFGESYTVGSSPLAALSSEVRHPRVRLFRNVTGDGVAYEPIFALLVDESVFSHNSTLYDAWEFSALPENNVVHFSGRVVGRFGFGRDEGCAVIEFSGVISTTDSGSLEYGFVGTPSVTVTTDTSSQIQARLVDNTPAASAEDVRVVLEVQQPNDLFVEWRGHMDLCY